MSSIRGIACWCSLMRTKGGNVSIYTHSSFLTPKILRTVNRNYPVLQLEISPAGLSGYSTYHQLQNNLSILTSASIQRARRRWSDRGNVEQQGNEQEYSRGSACHQYLRTYGCASKQQVHLQIVKDSLSDAYKCMRIASLNLCCTIHCFTSYFSDDEADGSYDDELTMLEEASPSLVDKAAKLNLSDDEDSFFSFKKLKSIFS